MTIAKGTAINVELVATCTSIGGSNATLTPVANDLDFASTIVVNGGGPSFVVNDQYLIRISRR
jgi:hypothetical protein